MFDSNSVWIFLNVFLTSWLNVLIFFLELLNLVCLAGEGCQN